MPVANINPDDFDRLAKLIVDAGSAATFEDAEELLRGYRLQILIGPEACTDTAWQAALLTAVNAGARAMHGGVTVIGATDVPCVLPLAYGSGLADAVRFYGGKLRTESEEGIATIAIAPGAAGAPCGPAVYPFAGQWVAGVSDDLELTVAGAASVPAAVLAACIAVSECFQRLRGYAAATERTVGVSLWNPELRWDEHDAEGPPIDHLPVRLWLLGLGHLGQAYAWLLSLLPYPQDVERLLILQDDDRLTHANRATSMLDGHGRLRLPKTRAVAAATELAGWDTQLVERRYRGGALRGPQDPLVLLAGVDNTNARRRLDETGFPVILDGGLGAGSDGFLAMAIRALPAERPSRELWTEAAERPADVGAPAYRALELATGDRCGVEQLAGRSVATAFVGVTAACWTLGGLLRELHGGTRYELLDYSLRAPGRVTSIAAGEQRPPRIPTVPAVMPPGL